MMDRLKSRWAIGGAALLVLFSAACVRIAPMAWSRISGPTAEEVAIRDVTSGAGIVTPGGGGPSVAVPATGAATGRQSATVRRGTITEVVQLTGRLAGQDEVPLSVPAPGRVQSVAVKPGQAIAEGQVLLEMDSKLITRDLNAARTQLESLSIRLKQAQAQAEAKQREDQRKQQLERTSSQRAVADAESGLVQAQANFDRVRAGAAPAERETAAAAVTAAQAAVDKAEGDLARLQNGTPLPEVQAAEQQVTTTRLLVQKAEADLARLKAGVEPAVLRSAERDLVTAQSTFDRAQSEAARIAAGSDPFDIRAGERAVERAQISLQAAEAIPATDANRAARDSTIANARVALKEAQEQLARLKEPSRPSAIEAARRAADAAKLDLDGAHERLEMVKKGPDQLTLDTAQATVDGARLTQQTAEARLQSLQAGTSQDQITAAQQVVNSVRSNLTIARARQAELLSHPTDSEMRDAQAKLTSAQAAYDRVRAEAQPAPPPVDPAQYDLVVQQQGVDAVRAQVETIERELAATQLRAPFAATVVAVHVRSGDPLEPGQPALILTKTGDSVVRADVAERDVNRIAIGQDAAVQFEAKDSTPVSASVTEVGPGGSGGGPAAVLRFVLPENVLAPAFGTAAQVSINVSTKENVLLVPQKAVRSAGTRRYVEYMDGNNRRVADVQVGIASGPDVEVVSGLSEGQVVLISQ
jgi:RND family efflux transporter MFP subunit